MDLRMTRTLWAAGPIPLAGGRPVNVHDRESIVAVPRWSVADPLSGVAHPATRRLSNVRFANVTPIAVSRLWAIIRVASTDVPISPVSPTAKITRATMVSTSENPSRLATGLGGSRRLLRCRRRMGQLGCLSEEPRGEGTLLILAQRRSEERRVGKEGGAGGAWEAE